MTEFFPINCFKGVVVVVVVLVSFGGMGGEGSFFARCCWLPALALQPASGEGLGLGCELQADSINQQVS